MHRQFVPTESRPPDMRCLSHCSSSSLFFFSSTGHLLNLALMKISLLYLPQQRYITADAKGVFSLRTVLDWPTFRAVVDSKIAPLFDLFLGLSAWIQCIACMWRKRYDNQGQGTSAIDVIWDLTHVIANIPCIPLKFCMCAALSLSLQNLSCVAWNLVYSFFNKPSHCIAYKWTLH